MTLLFVLVSTAFAGYSAESWRLVGTRGEGTAVVAHVLVGSATASYRVLHGATAEWCAYGQATHDSLYSSASGLEADFQKAASLVMPSCWSDITSAGQSEVYALYRAMQGSADADWTIEVHRVVPSLTGSSETFAQADFEALRSAAEKGSAAFNVQASSLLGLLSTPWSSLSSANQAAILETFDWIDGD